ncbi:50S ribosomal protein L4 [Limisphaera ngatamarikiensis]|jgi:large subunit ribosomal protein L4|uniref:Large ribosomal subunit protein uL4 n=1 Tax=Limisphaera ngatamarikiensis TaxID=1324935 RepID=A0A6M1RHJ6_9BACT|nr:50S ribosomal protein L4 [Limisphaera ngatamarikiensis]NGO39538.1 50S ribosomal protein L4 [Limisphaera ngatamarikiensis]
MKLVVKDTLGKPQGELEVTFPLVEGMRGTQAVHDVVVAHLANRRRGTACTKTMGEVAGTGKKPWRQKGTGRARAGSFQSPLWRGGGVVFGPKPRDFSLKVNEKTKRLALRKALTERLKAGDVIVVDELSLPNHKTRNFLNVLKTLEVKGTVLVVASPPDRNLLLASRNIPFVEVTTGENLHTYDVLRPDTLLFTRAAFEKVQERLREEES